MYSNKVTFSFLFLKEIFLIIFNKLDRYPRPTSSGESVISLISSLESNPRPLKRVTVFEELIELAKDPTLAIIFNQFLLYTRSAKDIDKMLEEESRIRVIGPIAEETLDINVSPRYGWIYKRVSGLLSDMMLNISNTTMRRCISTLVKNGWLEKRKNSFNKWGQSKQFRYNISKLQQYLRALGYPLDGFSLDKKDYKQKHAS